MTIRCLMVVLLAAWMPTAGAAEPQFPAGKWVSLFNGNDLTDWTPKIRGYKFGENFGDTFRVEDGLIKVRYDAYDKFDRRFGHLFYRHQFSHYRLKVEYRFVGEQIDGGPGWAFRNSGLMLHGQDPATMTVDQEFPVSIEVQLLGGDGTHDRTTSNLCTPGTNVVMDESLFEPHCRSSSSKTHHLDEWVTAEVEVHGGGIMRHILDGEVVIEYTEPQLDPRDEDAKRLIQGDNLLLQKGTISLQSESHPCEFRKVEIMVLESE
jgi:hypothetical protein